MTVDRPKSSMSASMVHTMSMYSSLMVAASIRSLISLGVFDHLPSDFSAPSPLREVAKGCGVDIGLLRRLLWLPASVDFVRRTGDEEVGHTALSMGYRTGHASANLMQTVCDEAMRTALVLPAWLRTQDIPSEPRGMHGRTHNAFTFRDDALGRSLFSIMSQDPERASNFHKGLDALHQFFPLTGFYNLEDVLERRLSSNTLRDVQGTDQKLIVDVGGGSGAFLAQVLRDFPTLSPKHVVLQELPYVIELARRNAALPSGICLQVHDFFDEQPVRNARAYHIRLCLHYYNDELCMKILQRIVDAMGPQSKLLVLESILPDTAQVCLAGPLDMTMLLCGGIVRTEKQFVTLFASVGLKIRKIHRVTDSTWAMIETSR